MLANFLLWREDADFFMAPSRDIVEAVRQRISKFVLRSRVTISDASGSIVLYGLGGPQAQGAVQDLLPASDAPKSLKREDGIGTAMRLADGRYVLAATESDAPSLRQRLAGSLRLVDPRAWRWLDIRNGVPLVTAATQDRLVPQMANLEILGGVSFSKGCYTGQEIVARTQHLGKVKRRMFLANTAAAAAAGDELYCEDLGDQAAGLVVNAESSPDGGCDLLAVLPSESRERSVVHLGAMGGPALRFLALPYGAE
jgi:folate-binding protein YgfZ